MKHAISLFLVKKVKFIYRNETRAKLFVYHFQTRSYCLGVVGMGRGVWGGWGGIVVRHYKLLRSAYFFFFFLITMMKQIKTIYIYLVHSYDIAK